MILMLWVETPRFVPKMKKMLDNSYGICQRTLPLNFKNLEQRLYEEFNRLRVLEESVEHILNKL